MKKIYMTMVAMLCGVAAMAQNEVYINDVTVASAKETAQTVNLQINLKNTDAVSAVAFKVHTPAGLTIANANKWSFNEDRIDMAMVCYLMEDDGASAADNYSIARRKSGNDWQFELAPATSGYKEEGVWHGISFLGNDGNIMTAPLTIAAGTEDGVYEVRFYDISVSDTQETAQSILAEGKDEITVSVTVGAGTGINDIKGVDSKAPVYNLAGQRVNKAQKGVFIQNGKKVAVK